MSQRIRKSLLRVVVLISLLFTSVGPTVTRIAIAEGAEQATAGSPPKPQLGPDADGDWVSDLDEKRFASDPALIDSDNDGMTDFEEIFILNTKPAQADLDADADGLFDQVEQQLFKTDPKQANEDQDGDLLPDEVEAQMHTDPQQPDTDGDLLSDFLELFWLKSDPNATDIDSDQDRYPDIIQTWLPSHLKTLNCEIEVTMAINAMVVHDPEEADLIGAKDGDEINVFYGLKVGNKQIDDMDLNAVMLGNEYPQSSSASWKGETFQGDKIATFQPLKPISAQCGQSIAIGIMALEVDKETNTSVNLGRFRADQVLLIQGIPIDWKFSLQGEHKLTGNSDNGSFDYQMEYLLKAATLEQKPSDNTTVTTVVTAYSEATGVNLENFTDTIKQLLPNIYIAENKRLAFRYPVGWRVQQSETPLATTENFTITNGTAVFVGKPGQIAISVFEPVYVMEQAHLPDRVEATPSALFKAFIQNTQKGISIEGVREDKLGNRPAILLPASLNSIDTLWLAFLSADNSLAIVRIASTHNEFKQFEQIALTIAETINYQMPSRKLDEVEKVARKYVVSIAQGNSQVILSSICQRDRETGNSLNDLTKLLLDVDSKKTPAALARVAPNFTGIDVSKLYYETKVLDEKAGIAEVRVSGNTILNRDQGRQAVPFQEFNLGQRSYRLRKENGSWLICSS